MTNGDKIRTVFGKTETVMTVENKRIFTYEYLGGWYHPTKVFPIDSPDTGVNRPTTPK